jgi:sterol desaturase/sphingolipid hydroxylase (fatty acid hydroxylase superfamily)
MRHRVLGSRSSIGGDSLSAEQGSEQERNDYLNQEVSSWTAMAAVGAAFGLLFLLEWIRPLRPEVESKIRRTGRNLAVAGISAAALRLAERPVSLPLARRAHRRGWGLLKQRKLSPKVELILGVLLLDYTLYLWHILAHKIPLLWRFHQAHHVDLDLDASTAVRFHFGELVISVLWRSAQIALLGIAPRTLSFWNVALLVEILFHHSNLRLPWRWERWLNYLVVTPRMHGIHHSIVPEETGSNWSSGLTLWDYLHRTLRLNVPQDEITIGVPAYQDPKELVLPRILEMPFEAQRPSWRDRQGREPARRAMASARTQLLP